MIDEELIYKFAGSASDKSNLTDIDSSQYEATLTGLYGISRR